MPTLAGAVVAIWPDGHEQRRLGRRFAGQEVAVSARGMWRARPTSAIRRRAGAGRRELVCAFLAFALAGCGGENADERRPGAQSKTPETQAPATTGEAVRVVIEAGEVIGPGSEGENVRDLQQALAILEYDPGEPDGVYGPATRKAVIAFQKNEKLRPDGLVGPLTAAAINRELERKGASGGD
jgi:hypothetical protein